MGSNSDFKAHSETYAGFTAMMKWGTIASFLVGAVVVLLISN